MPSLIPEGRSGGIGPDTRPTQAGKPEGLYPSLRPVPDWFGSDAVVVVT